MNIKDLKPPYTLTIVDGQPVVEYSKPVYVELNGEYHKVKPENPMYFVVTHYGKTYDKIPQSAKFNLILSKLRKLLNLMSL